MRTLIFHTMVAPHVQQDALALLESEQLVRFHTAFHHEPNRTWQKWLIRAGRLVKTDFNRELRKRTLDPSLAPFTISNPWRELARLAADRVDRSHRLGDLVWENAECAFDRSVARRGLTADVQAVFGYEHACLDTFAAAKASGRRTAYVLPAPEPGFVDAMLNAEAERFPILRTPFRAHTAPREGRRAARRRAEWDLADTIMVASAFTRDTFARAGRDVSRVHLVPLGAPPPASEEVCLRGGTADADRPVFLWAGTFSVRKGAHYLLQAWRDGQLGRFARLKIFGSIGLPDALMRPLPDGIEAGGAIPRHELMAEYQHADALIFPTLCDGFGMVATEAWSRGLPVITTDRAGAADKVKPGENGLLIPAADAAALRANLEWCIDHRAALRAMRHTARQTAADWQWSDYRKQVANVVAGFASK